MWISPSSSSSSSSSSLSPLIEMVAFCFGLDFGLGETDRKVAGVGGLKEEAPSLKEGESLFGEEGDDDGGEGGGSGGRGGGEATF
mmetsp:Transcript_30550/g.42146  ORF Transcript_30550/g.42146 Transcript_30550/m.42146 type:complete len:85 (+) Transcript_30550:159-413(+)